MKPRFLDCALPGRPAHLAQQLTASLAEEPRFRDVTLGLLEVVLQRAFSRRPSEAA